MDNQIVWKMPSQAMENTNLTFDDSTYVQNGHELKSWGWSDGPES